ncbi:MAG: exodeoxyribonuclease VII large subunit [Candidatus Aegiribacteria sp.]|nr:exodeoxyribonuclease VII large subunit [Candidatus Aegiribacteria sp.]
MRPAGITISDYSEASSDFTVLSLNRRVGELLSTAFPQPVWVRGEIAETSSTNARGHTYFRLVEPSPDGMGQPLAVIDCALFAGSRPPIVRTFAREGQVFQLTEGMAIRIQGRITLWDKGGRYQLIVNDIDPSWTMGNQAKRLRRLVDKLRKEGILEANGELDMPLAPLNVGLITARGSAAEKDFIKGLKDSQYPFKVRIAYAPMQGIGTARGVIDSFNRLLMVPDLDAVVLTRGGGSSTDLAWFNDEHIASVISQVPWPVISAIGHETDTTLPDFASHTRVKTPTHAANYLVNRMADLLSSIDSLAVILHRSASRGVAAARERLSTSVAVLSRSSKLIFRAQKQEINSLEDWLVRCAGISISAASGKLKRCGISLEKVLETGNTRRLGFELDSLEREIASSVSRKLEINLLRIENLEAVVKGNNPERLYSKGWATVRGKNGKLLRSISDTAVEETIEVILRDGSLMAKTEMIIPERTDNE